MGLRARIESESGITSRKIVAGAITFGTSTLSGYLRYKTEIV